MNLWNFDKPIFCEQIGRKAWGYVDYEKPVAQDLLQSYEMVGGGLPKEFTVKVTSITTLTVEAESEDEAIDKACSEAWKYDADEMNAEILKEGN